MYNYIKIRNRNEADKKMAEFLEEKFNYILGGFFAFIIFGLIVGG